MKRITEKYDEQTKEDLYGELQKRREDRKDQEGANHFDGITSASTKAEIVSALEGDGTKKSDDPNAPEAPLDPPTRQEQKELAEQAHKTKPHRSANENVEAGGHPTGTVPGGTT